MPFEERIDVSAPRQLIFAIYADVGSWATWDPDVRSSAITGAFVSGSTGTLKPSGGPEARITLTEVVADRSFTVESRLPFCVMRFEHELSDSVTGTIAIHRVSFSGPLAPVFARLIGSRIHKGLARTMAGLKRAAEQAHNSPREAPHRSGR